MSTRSVKMAKKSDSELQKIVKSGSLSAAAAQYELTKRNK